MVNNYLFFMVLFFAASISGIIIYIGKSFKKKNKLQAKSLFWGVIFGIPNFFSLVFFLNALENKNLDSSTVFCLTSIGVVISSSITGYFLFKEKLTANNWICILAVSCAIYLFYN